MDIGIELNGCGRHHYYFTILIFPLILDFQLSTHFVCRIVSYTFRWDEPLYPAEELRWLGPLDARSPYNPKAILDRILDGSRLEEFKSNYGKTLITGERGFMNAPNCSIRYVIGIIA
jgi:hypothetical protein